MSAPDAPPDRIPSVSALQRPLIYQHEFTAREDLLSMLLSRSDFDVIKGGHFEGAIHVVFLLLILTTIRLGAQSLWEHSEVAGQVLSLPTCLLHGRVLWQCDVLLGTSCELAPIRPPRDFRALVFLLLRNLAIYPNFGSHCSD
jgi:hypothetical protein